MKQGTWAGDQGRNPEDESLADRVPPNTSDPLQVKPTPSRPPPGSPDPISARTLHHSTPTPISRAAWPRVSQRLPRDGTHTDSAPPWRRIGVGGVGWRGWSGGGWPGGGARGRSRTCVVFHVKRPWAMPGGVRGVAGAVVHRSMEWGSGLSTSKARAKSVMQEACQFAHKARVVPPPPRKASPVPVGSQVHPHPPERNDPTPDLPGLRYIEKIVEIGPYVMGHSPPPSVRVPRHSPTLL